MLVKTTKMIYCAHARTHTHAYTNALTDKHIHIQTHAHTWPLTAQKNLATQEKGRVLLGQSKQPT